MIISTIFVNLPIENLRRAVDFFTGLGFTFNAQYTGEDSTCMVVSDSIYVMLVERDKFRGFIDKEIAPRDTAEAILSFGLESRDEVTALAEKAFALGARRVNDPEDHGFMFSWAFEDLDGHLWDLFWMDPTYVQPTE